uniref:Uncharacterized protein TCIL3000_1_460 n=1 Tax=Trypanosoma congolense (strain IL3000) TaxID=1068625 RepID=G0UIT8_TRYCI|nr:unnamed protein product [Trypanosoma congolense IL3000]
MCSLFSIVACLTPRFFFRVFTNLPRVSQRIAVLTTGTMNSSARKGTTATALMSTKNFLELIPLDVDLETTRQLVLKGKNITAIPPNIGVLLREVRRLDLTENDIRDVAPLATLTNLTSVNLTKNQRLLSVAALAPLQLTVCVLAHCGLRSLAGLEGSAATLRTLIVNDNNLVLQSPHGCSVDGVEVEDLGIAVKNYEVIACLTGCETLVLSRNPLLCSLCVHQPRKEKEGRDEKRSLRREVDPSVSRTGLIPSLQ